MTSPLCLLFDSDVTLVDSETLERHHGALDEGRFPVLGSEMRYVVIARPMDETSMH
jgi:hypothetical protein